MDEENNNQNIENNENSDNTNEVEPSQETTEKVTENQSVKRRIIEDEMKESYMAYSMSVIVGRALPDVRDGLKPVHRRILYAMNDMGLSRSKPYKKSARIVGEVLGKYHPHGDSAVYDSMVRMVQPFSLRYPLVNGQGNFGSVDGDSAAAMRYTEARMHYLSEEMLQDIEKETVKFSPNFDGSLEEPTILPSKIPNLLMNGSSGIAVGMATNIPPHNLKEICQGIIKTIDNPEISIPELMEYIKAPDFPTGGIITGQNGIINAFKTGRGKIKLRAKIHQEKNSLIVTEIPYQVNKSLLIEQIADLVKNKKIQGISDIRDESDRDGMRIVIILKLNANPEIVENHLIKHTRLQTTFGAIMLALVDNQPKVLNLKQLIQHFISHRQTIVRKRTEYDLKKAQERSHLLNGLIIALDDIDTAVGLIKSAKSGKEAQQLLMNHFKIDEKQSQAILDMKLQRLTSMEQDKIREEQEQLVKKIAALKEILADEQKILNIIKEELSYINQKYGDERRTQIITSEYEEMLDEDFIESEEVVVTVSHSGYAKRLPIDTYKQQKRGGKGIIGASTKEEDFIEHLFIANTHSYILIFTNKGKVHWLKVFQIPESSRQAKGVPFINLIQLDKDEKINAFVPIKEFNKENYVFFATEKGVVKKTSLEQFSRPRRGGIQAISLSDDDHLINVVITNGNNNIILATQNGMACHFSEKKVRSMGRTASGVRGVKLKGDDKLIGMVKAEKTLLTVTNKGFGKRSNIEDYRLTNRGGVGVINLKTTEKNEKVVSIKNVSDDDEIILISKNGIIIRVASKGISVIGRSTQGVRIMRMSEGDELIAVEKIVNED